MAKQKRVKEEPTTQPEVKGLGYSKDEALQMKPNFSLSCLQEAEDKWRLTFTQPVEDGGWRVGTFNHWGFIYEEKCFTHELEANQRFHQLLGEWSK